MALHTVVKMVVKSWQQCRSFHIHVADDVVDLLENTGITKTRNQWPSLLSSDSLMSASVNEKGSKILLFLAKADISEETRPWIRALSSNIVCVAIDNGTGDNILKLSQDINDCKAQVAIPIEQRLCGERWKTGLLPFTETRR